MKTAALVFCLLTFAACQSCKTTDGQPQPAVVTAAVTCGAPAAAELIQDATAALASLDSEWRPHLTAAATKYGAEALNCAIQQLLAGWQAERAVSVEQQRSAERAFQWLWPASGGATTSPPEQLPRSICCSKCTFAPPFQCVFVYHCNVTC